jgi:hypothetical protein
MSDTENLGSFFKENKKHLKDYLDTRLDILRLRLIRIFSKSAGYFIWIIISLFLLWVFIIFLGLVTGFWLSSLTGSYTIGFGITALILLVLIVALALLRKALFVNPIIKLIIKNANEETEEGDE